MYFYSQDKNVNIQFSVPNSLLQANSLAVPAPVRTLLYPADEPCSVVDTKTVRSLFFRYTQSQNIGNPNDYSSSSSLDFQYTIKHLDDYIMLHAWTYSIYGYRLPC